MIFMKEYMIKVDISKGDSCFGFTPGKLKS